MIISIQPQGTWQATLDALVRILADVRPEPGPTDYEVHVTVRKSEMRLTTEPVEPTSRPPWLLDEADWKFDASAQAYVVGGGVLE
jgi:hypothetical protein